MGEKKKPGRFTLQFNLKDPQQKAVSELLEQQGRHKAQLITSAIMQYTQSPRPQDSIGGTSAIDPAEIERLLLSIMEKHPQFAAASVSGAPSAKLQPEEPIATGRTWDNPVGDDAMAAISETLAAFQRS